jgi:O-antigen ligase
VINSPSQEATWSRRVILGVCGAILVFAPLAFGAVHTWAYCTIGLIVGALSLILIGYGLYLIKAKPLEVKALPYPPLWWLGAGLIGVIFLQIIPWPQGVVRWLSPSAWEIRSLGTGLGLAEYLPLSLNPCDTIIESLKLWPGVCLFFILIYTVNSRRQILILAGIILAVAFFEILYGFSELQRHFIWDWRNPYNQNDRLCGTFISANHLAMLLTMAILLGFGLFLTYKGSKAGGKEDVSGWARLRRESRAEHLEPHFRGFILLFFLLLLTVGLIFTGSRGGMISLLFGFTLIGLFIRSQRWKWSNFILIAIFLAASLLYSLLLGSGKPLSRFQNFFDVDRVMAFKGALQVFADFPVIGSGLATFGDVFYRYEPAELSGAYFIQTHNDWLQLLAETGLLGFLPVLATWLFFFFKMTQQWRQRQDRWAKRLGLGALAALGAGAYHAVTDFPFHIPALNLVYATIAAIAYLSLHSHRQAGLEYFSYATSDWNHAKKIWGTALCLLISLNTIFLSQIGYHMVAESVAPMEINSTREPRPHQADDFRQALALNQRNSKYYLGLAETLEKPGDRQALAEVEQALKSAVFFAPARWGCRQKLAEFYLRHYHIDPGNYIPTALKELDAAVKLFPESARLNLYLGRVLAWADMYYEGLVPRELQGQSGNYFNKALRLNPNMKQYRGLY